jgi:hypothetical protein
MVSITISKKELKETVKESVREVLSQELKSLRAALVPLASDEEQKDIETRYRKPIRKAVKSRKIQL